MAEHGHKIAYLLVEKGAGDNKRTYWRAIGAAYPCRDGSLNLKLDIHPGLTFNIRTPKSNGEREEVDAGYAIESDFGNNSFHNSDQRAGNELAQQSAHQPASTALTTTATTNPITAADFTADLDDELNDSTFICENCGRTTLNEEARALFSGGAVCETCGDAYKSCGRCDYYFPKSVKGRHCPRCGGSGSGKASQPARITSQKGGGR